MQREKLNPGESSDDKLQALPSPVLPHSLELPHSLSVELRIIFMSDSEELVVRIATRASQLALWQAHHVAGLILAEIENCVVEIVHISTEGDRDRNRSLATMGGVGVFTREVQSALLDGRADIAVHSLKDLPTESAPGLALGAVPERASVYDALILPGGTEVASDSDAESLLKALPAGAKIGTGSLRRQAQLRHFREDLQLLDIRGNVETRLKKLDDGEYDAIILAEAGLRRLKLDGRISATLQPPLMLHAVGQGALGIECRADDERVLAILKQLTVAGVLAAVTAERGLLRELRAGCHAPVGVSTRTDHESIHLDGVVLSADGRTRIAADFTGAVADAEVAGIALAQKLIEAGAGELLSAESARL